MLELHVSLLLLALAWPQMSQAVGESGSILYPYGLEHGDVATPKSDDGSSPEILITVNITFMNHTHGSVYVNNNGHISFKKPVSSYRPSPFPLMELCPLIAIFWADISNVHQGIISYRQSQDPELLQNVTYSIQRSYPHLAFNARWAFIATWEHVGYYGSNSSKGNTFQVVLTTDGNLTFTIFNYYHIQWTSGRSTGGDRNTGLGGTPAQAGLCGRGHQQYYNIPGSMTPDILHIGSTSNVNMPGHWIFRVDQLFLPNGCIFNGEFIPHGTTFWNSNTCFMQCQCTALSEIHCHRQPCASNELCQPSSGHHICQPASYKTCTVSGGFHFRTFDERFLHLPGTCSFILSNLCWDSAHLTPFTVTAKMEEPRLTSRAWPALVKVIVYEHELTLPTGRPGHILGMMDQNKILKEG